MIRALDEYAALRAVEFDCPFRVGHSGRVYDRVESVYAPEVYNSDETDVEILSDDWEAFSAGYTGQWGYNGPVMHQSEFIGGALADDILSSPGMYVVCTVEVLPSDDDPEPLPAGWIVLRKREES